MRRANRLGSLLLVGLAAVAPASCGAPPEDVSLGDAVRQGDLEAIDWYVDRGEDLDVQFETGMTPLMLAAARNDVDVGAALLDGGARIDQTGREGMTALQVAARLGSSEFLVLLLDRGAGSQHVSDNGMATIHGRSRLIPLLDGTS